MTVISSWERDPFHAMFNSITSGIHFAVTLTLNLWQWSPYFFAMKTRPFSKSHQNFELGGFSIGYVIATSELADSQVSPFSPTRTTFELGGFSIGYVIVTSEPTDSQVSPFRPTRTTSSFVASQSVMSLRPLNRQIAKSHLSVRQGLLRAWL